MALVMVLVLVLAAKALTTTGISKGGVLSSHVGISYDTPLCCSSKEAVRAVIAPSSEGIADVKSLSKSLYRRDSTRAGEWTRALHMTKCERSMSEV